jgi:methylenetetrahydrofolate dehydrogenase (NADP+)/methenyltetrahydrofolate cyclohydrolase
MAGELSSLGSMAATVMDGRALAARIRERVAEEARPLAPLALATILVGEDPASEIYISHKHAAAEEAGIAAVDIRLPVDVPQSEVLERIARLNADDEIDGILVQTPLPDHIDVDAVQAAVDPAKDVDGFHPLNAGLLYLGRPAHVPATPLGIMALLAEYRIPIEGARAVVVGRSPIVGRPVAALLTHANATVTVCHSRTVELQRHTLDADILVAAIGIPGTIAPDMVKQGSTVIDVGITRTDAGLVGDVDPGAAGLAAYMTPVPGGVGPMTIALVLEGTLRAARYRRGMLAFPRV